MSQKKAYGCLFCVTGREEAVVRCIRDYYPFVNVLVAYREKHKSKQGTLTKEKDILLPGYVFFEVEDSFNPFDSFSLNGVIRVLTTEAMVWQLQGKDYAFVDWLFERDGLLEMSQGYRENDKVRIIKGPLKDLEGAIRKIDRHSRRGMVELSFEGRVMKVWLSFELVESPKGGC